MTKTAVKKKSKSRKAKKPDQRPSKFIGPGIFKYHDDRIHVDLVQGLRVERKEGETDKELEKRAVKESYKTLKLMLSHFKEHAYQQGFKTK